MILVRRVSILIFSLVVMAVPAQAADIVHVGLAGLSGNLIHPFIAKDAGFFQKYGIDARLVVFEGGSLLAQAAIAGEVKFSVTSGPVTITSRSQGADTIIVAAYMNVLPYSMVAAKAITRWEQLKGKKIAISRFGSGTDTAVRLVLEKFGLNPGKEVTILQLGAQPSRFAGLINGAVDATIIAPPFDVTAKKQGYSILANIAELGIPYPQEVIETTDRYVREHPAIVKNFLKAFLESIHFAVTNKDGAKKIMTQYLKITDPEILDATYQRYLQTTDRNSYPNMQGMSTAVEEVAKRLPAAKIKKPEDFVNNKFLDELEKEGFYQQLYR